MKWNEEIKLGCFRQRASVKKWDKNYQWKSIRKGKSIDFKRFANANLKIRYKIGRERERESDRERERERERER